MRNKYLALVLGILFVGIVLGDNRAYAHCDTLDGPVIQDARIALEKGEVTPVLKWVKKDAEAEIQAAFTNALNERKANKEAAEMKFFETLVRVHRAGEGADFTGLKPAGAVEPIIAQADEALETGSVDALVSQMSGQLINTVKERFALTLEAKKHKDESVEAGREFVEAYVSYVHYVEGLQEKMSEKGSHHSEKSD